MKKLICICDTEPEYAGSLMNLVNSHPTLPYEMKAFSNTETLLEFLEGSTVDVLLIAPEYYSGKIKEAGVPYVFFLTRGGKVPSKWSLPQINKYQRVDRILQIILEKTEPDQLGAGTACPQLIGIYSPLHRVGKTTFALALCRELNRDGTALYINLEEISGLGELLEREYQSDLTDLLYYARMHPEKFPMYLSMIAQETQGIHYIPPARVPMELKAVGLEEWQSFLLLLRESGMYDSVILDFGDGIRGLPDLLNEMDRIYMPVASDYISCSKIRQYEEMMEIMDYNDLLEHTRKIRLPGTGFVRESGNYLQELMWSPMGGFARELLEESTDEPDESGV